MTQLAFNLEPLVQPDYEPQMTLAERFAEFDRRNPHVADALDPPGSRAKQGPSCLVREKAAERFRGATGGPCSGGRR